MQDEVAVIHRNLTTFTITVEAQAFPFEGKIDFVPQVQSQAQAVMDNPAGYYFNMHSPLNPGGVIRGQLVRVR